MRRREFIFVLGGGAVWPLALRAQTSGKVWRMGFMAYRHESFYDALFERLRELGYVEGQNLIVERRYAGGHVERFQSLADELVQLNVDIIIVVTTPAGLAAKRATKTIPIIHPAAIDPVGTGLVASLAHPGGNLTGVAVLNAELSAKRFELLQELVQGLARAGVLWNVANPANRLAWKDTEAAARALGVALESYEVREPEDFEGVYARITQSHPDALHILQDALTLQHRRQIIDFTLRSRVPSMFVGREWVLEGGLIAYGDRLPDRYRRAAEFVDKIFKGAKPADLPVEQPTEFDLAVNLKTARTIGLPISPAFLARATEVIE
jgi:putative tryptophan/tyrosine transport system substrate-binding protein